VRSKINDGHQQVLLKQDIHNSALAPALWQQSKLKQPFFP
jgi:hypothetical protein